MGKGKKNKNYFHNVAAGYFFNCLYYKKTNNPLFLWSVYRLCREENIAIPEWVYEYFDKCADKLLTDNDLPGDKVAPLCSEALGFKSLGPGTPWKEVKKEIRKSKAHRAVKDAEKASPKNFRYEILEDAIKRLVDDIGHAFEKTDTGTINRWIRDYEETFDPKEVKAVLDEMRELFPKV